MAHNVVSTHMGVTTRLYMLVTCILMMYAIVRTLHGNLFTYDLAEFSVKDMTSICTPSNRVIVGDFSNLALDMPRCSGPTQLKLYIKDGEKNQISLLEIIETLIVLEIWISLPTHIVPLGIMTIGHPVLQDKWDATNGTPDCMQQRFCHHPSA